MGCEELIGSLHKASELKIQQIWRKAEEEAGAVRGDLSTEISGIRAESLRTAAAARSEEVSGLLAAARSEARLIRMSAEKNISERLLQLARCCLADLRGENYKNDFGSLAGEIPPLAWENITINPQDRGIAEEYFPYAKIISDIKVAGGFSVSGESGRVKVINTLEKRLERAWPELCPALIKEVYDTLTNENSSAQP